MVTTKRNRIIYIILAIILFFYLLKGNTTAICETVEITQEQLVYIEKIKEILYKKLNLL